MDVTKLPRVGGRDNMLPRAGESALDQLRERVQGLEEEPAAATFDAEGEPVVEMDEGDEVAARPGWAVHGGNDPVRTGIAKVVGDVGGGMYMISEARSNAGALELKPNGFDTKTAYTIDLGTTWEVDDYVFYVSIPKASGGNEYYIERSAGPGPAAYQQPWSNCASIAMVDAAGRTLGWYYYNYPNWVWYSPWGYAAPDWNPPL